MVLNSFNQTAIKFEPNFSVATPKGYVLGPGDEVIVLLTGLNESSVRSKVSPEGNLQIPYAGIVYVNGFTIEQATNLIRSKMTKVYPALSSGQTQLAINLGNTRSIKITIVGEVKHPDHIPFRLYLRYLMPYIIRGGQIKTDHYGIFS